MVVRQSPRYPAMFSGTLVYQNRSHTITQSVDISRTGCKLKSTAPVFAGMNVDLLLYVPGEEVPLLIQQATVRWSGKLGIGIEFQHLAFPHQERLDTFLHQLTSATYN